MKIIDITFSYDSDTTTVEQLLRKHSTSEGWSRALHNKHVEVVVMKRSRQADSLIRNGIHYHFLNDSLPMHPKPWQVPFTFLRRVRNEQADIVHVHGLMFPMAVFILRLLLPKKTAIIVQQHAGKPSKGLKGYLYALFNRVADGFFFTTNEHGKEWFSKADKKVMPVMEGSNYFIQQDKVKARAAINMKGNPVFLWVGRLDSNKDPLTLLKGFEQLLARHTSATLYMVYGDKVLEKEVQQTVKASSTLQQSVHLVGAIANAQLEAYYSGADYFVLGSHHEGSGYALSEALACGCIPIVTNIPSFRMMTDNGRLGTLWQTGNSQSFSEAAQAVMKKDIDTESKRCIDFFSKELSFYAIADKAVHYYQQVIGRRQY